MENYNNYNQEKENKTTKNKKNKKTKVGTLGSIIELTKRLIADRPRLDKKKKIDKKDIIAVILTIICMLAIGAILWFVPFTHEFMKNFLFLK